MSLGAHRRIDAGITARHLVAGRARKQRESAHERAADAENMDMHGRAGE